MKEGDKLQAFLPFPNNRWHRAVYLCRSGDYPAYLVVRLEDGPVTLVHQSLVKTDDDQPLPNDIQAESWQISRKACAWLLEYDVGDAPTHWVTFQQDLIQPHIETLCRCVKISNARVTALYRSKITTPYPIPEPKPKKDA